MKSLIKVAIAIAMVGTVNACSTKHNLIEPNETLLFGFETKDGKKAVLVKGTEENKLTFRFGKNDSLGVDFPLNNEAGKSEFIYAPTRDSIGSNTLQFEVGGMVYKIVEPIGQDLDPYITMNNKHSGEENTITSRINSKEGSLKGLQNNELVNLKTLE